MYKINTTTNSIEKLKESSFSDLSFNERDHLQEWIAKNPESLGEDLLTIQKEFSGFDNTNERLDLLALDKEGNLVVIENKLDDTGRDVVWQALKYTSYCSTLTTKQIIKIYQSYLDANNSDEDAKSSIMDFLQTEDESELFLNHNDQRIILIANNYRKEVTSTVFWLLDHDIQIQCYKVSPIVMGEQLFLNIEQIIPPPDTKELMISISEKKKEKKKSAVVREKEARLVRFWSQYKQAFSDSGHQHLDRTSISSRSHIGFWKGRANFGFVIGQYKCRVEIYIEDDKNKFLFDAMYKHKEQIENSIGETLIWQRLDGKKASRIKIETEGDDSWGEWKDENWSSYFEWYINSFDKFYKAIFPVWEKIQSSRSSK